jgi:hypothetical protein
VTQPTVRFFVKPAASPTGATSIQLRFTAASGKGAWVIDDVEIDPVRPR